MSDDEINKFDVDGILEIVKKNLSRKKCSDDEIKLMYILYRKGFSATEISRMLGRSIRTICGKLSGYGINFRRYNACEEEVKKWIEMYVEYGMNVKEIARECNVSCHVVSRYLKKCGVEIIDMKKSAELKFKKLNLDPSEELGYVFGVLYGDGCVYKGGIVLSVTDKDFVEEFKRCLKVIGFENIRERVIEYSKKNPKWKDQYEIRVANKPFSNWFSSLSYDDVYRMFSVDKRFAGAFLRGMFDSEGSCHRKRGIRVCNTDLELLNLCGKFLDLIGIKYHIREEKRKKRRKDEKQLYVLVVEKTYENYKKFNDYVGFSIVRKQLELDYALVDLESNWRIISLVKAGFKKDAVSCLLDVPVGKVGAVWASYNAYHGN